MRVLCVIPARIGSRRLPHKPLQRVGGQPLISLVANRIFELGLCDDIVVATDDEKVCRAVADVPVEAVMTSSSHRSGTDRVAEVARTRANELILNVQGDEPFIPKKALSGVIGLLQGGAGLATVATELAAQDVPNPNSTKISVSVDCFAQGFARQMNRLPHGQGDWVGRHVGVYGYRRSSLLRWATALPTPEEQELGLEQLRPMSYGESIAVARIAEVGPPGIDTIEDLNAAERYMTTMTEHVQT